MSPVDVIRTEPDCDRAKMATELSGPLAIFPVEVILTSPWVCALMPMDAAPDTAIFPDEVMSTGP